MKCECPHCGDSIDMLLIVSQAGTPVAVHAEARAITPAPILRPRPASIQQEPAGRRSAAVHRVKRDLDEAGAKRRFTLAEVAALLGVSTDTVRRRSKAGKLPDIVNARILATAEELMTS